MTKTFPKSFQMATVRGNYGEFAIDGTGQILKFTPSVDGEETEGDRHYKAILRFDIPEYFSWVQKNPNDVPALTDIDIVDIGYFCRAEDGSTDGTEEYVEANPDEMRGLRRRECAEEFEKQVALANEIIDEIIADEKRSKDILQSFTSKWAGTEEELEQALELFYQDIRSSAVLAGLSEEAAETVDSYVETNYF